MSIMKRPKWIRFGHPFWMPVVGMPEYAEGDTFIWRQYDVKLEVVESRAIGEFGHMIKVRCI